MPDREDVIAWLTEISLRPCDFATDDFDSYETERLANEAIEIANDAEIFCKQRNDAVAMLKEQEQHCCCLCGNYDTVDNYCNYHKHGVDVSEYCSRWIPR